MINHNGASLALTYMGTPIHDIAVEVAEQFTSDFATQEQFIEAFLFAYVVVTQPED